MNETLTPTWKLDMAEYCGTVKMFEFRTYVATVEEANAIVEAMPKSLKAKITTRYSTNFPNYDYGIYVEGRFPEATAHNAKNETGIKRFRKFVEMFGDQVTSFGEYDNAVRSLDEAIQHVNNIEEK